MINLYDIIQAQDMTCEAFADKRIYQAWLSFKKAGLRWKSERNLQSIPWDKIKDDDITEVDKADIPAYVKRCRRMKAGKEANRITLGFKNEELDCIFNAVCSEYGEIPKSPNSRIIWYRTDKRAFHRLTVAEMYDMLEAHDYLLVIEVDRDVVYRLQNKRRKSRADMIPDLSKADHESIHTTPGVLGKSGGGLDYVQGDMDFFNYCEDLAYKYRAEWKKILADRKFRASSDTSHIDSIVEKAMSLMMKISQFAAKNPDKLDRYDYGYIMRLIHDHERSHYGGAREHYKRIIDTKDGILPLYSRYCACVGDLMQGSGSESDLEKRDKYAKAIEEAYDEFVAKCAKYGIL